MKLRVKMWDSNVFKDFFFIEKLNLEFNDLFFAVVYGTLSVVFATDLGRPHS